MKGKITVLGVGAHPTDAFAEFGGTLANHAKRGDRVIVMALTPGIVVHTELLKGKSINEIKKFKIDEMKDSAKMIGAEGVRVLDFKDSPLVIDRKLLMSLADTIREIKPDIIIVQSDELPDRPEWYDDHGLVRRAVMKAISRYQPKSIYYGSYGMTTPFYNGEDPRYGLAPDVLVDITDVIELKIKALLCTKTWQIKDEVEFAKSYREIHERIAQKAGVPAKYAEAFRSNRRHLVQFLE